MAKSKEPGEQASVDDATLEAVQIDAPKVPAVLDPDDPWGLLPLSALGDDLAVTFMDFQQGVPGPGEADLVELGFMPKGAAFDMVDERWYPTSDLIVFPQTLKVPRYRLKEGVYEVAIQISRYGSHPVEGERKTLTIDTSKPNFGNTPGPVVFPAELGGVITETYLIQEGEVSVLVPWYIDVAVGDRAEYYWTDNESPPDSEVPIREQEFSPEDIADKRLRITVYADEIRVWGPGRRALYYYLRDRAGNEGPRSILSWIEVDLSPAPGALQPPKVPLSDRGVLDRQQARDGVVVEIPEYDFADATHCAAIFWDEILVDEIPIDPADFPAIVPVPWMNLHARGDGPRQASVYYRIRQGSTYGPPSPSTLVAVNLTLAGQDHANAPALINADLALVEVYGEKTLTLNTLLSADYGYPATVKLKLYDAPQAGQVLELYWGSYPGFVARYVVKASDVAGNTIRFSVPWNVIDTDKENPALPVYYTTSNGVNQQQSLPTPVRVQIVPITDLKEPVFPDAGKEGVLHCCSRPRLWEGVKVRVPADVRIEQGDVITLVWQGCAGPNGTQPIEGTYAEIRRDLTTYQPGEDVDIVVDDYDTLIAPMVNRGSALVHYRLKKRNGDRGNSLADFVIINRTLPSGEICSPTNDLCNEN
ncbi:hypothetical protein [Pseudomonas fluorescens]|uniref:hypothetical protein n=1 Tax=Pseudomonas fluorescens TaxID=294 RepID=UPI000F4843E6|nr:hypothetical protein [Pseudomonas fluorescens]